MKRSILPFLFILIVFCAEAQLDRSIRPKPGPAPEIQIGDYERFTLDNGLKVIVVENHKIPKVTYQLSLDIDPVMEGEQAGYVSLAGSLLRAGTTNRSKAEIDEAVDFIGASLNTYSTGISGSVLKKFSDDFLEIMSDVLLHPSFPAEELEKLKKQNISAIQASKSDASSIASNINSVVTFGVNHPYGEVVSEGSIEKITRGKCVDYYQSYFKPSAAYLIMVGDITLKEAKSQAEQYFGNWQQGEVPVHLYDLPALNSSPRVVIGNRDGAVQSVIMVSYPLQFKPGNPDAIKASVMNSVLGGGSLSSRLNANLREDKAFTYGAYSTLSADKLTGSFNASAEVKGTATDTAMQEVLYEMKRMTNERVASEMIEQVKNRMTGSFARSLERPETIAGFALNIEKYQLPQDYYATYLKKLSQVTPEDVQAMARKYLKPENANIIAVGDAQELSKTMVRFSKEGTVEEFDYYGRPVKAAEIPSSITAHDVILAYIKAIGGKENLLKVNDIRITYGAVMQGMNIEIVTSQKAPNKICVETKMGDQVLSKQIFDGVKGRVKSPMGEQELTDSDLEAMRIEATLHPELNLDELGITAELTGSGEVNGKKVWKVKMTLSTGMSTTDAYDQETGLKLQSVTQQGPMTVTTTYSDYREIEGVLYPFKSVQSLGPQVLEMETKSIEINSGINDSVFETL
jgi:zinc protease